MAEPMAWPLWPTASCVRKHSLCSGDSCSQQTASESDLKRWKRINLPSAAAGPQAGSQDGAATPRRLVLDGRDLLDVGEGLPRTLDLIGKRAVVLFFSFTLRDDVPVGV